MDTKKCSFSTMSRDTNTTRLPPFWDARAVIPSHSCTRHASGFVNCCRKPFAVVRGRNANQRAGWLFRNIQAVDSSVPKPESSCAAEESSPRTWLLVTATCQLHGPSDLFCGHEIAV